MAKLLGVVYRKIIMTLPPMPTNDTIYIDLSWTPLKITTFVIALALQTHGKDTQAASSVQTTFLSSEWELTPDTLNINFAYKRDCITVNAHIIPLPKSLTVTESGFSTNNTKYLNWITTDLWRTVVGIVSP